MAVNREILEETDIKLNLTNLEPFACIIGYYKDWPEKGKNRKLEIYYYEIKTNEKPKLENTEKYGDEEEIASEMLEILSIYKEIIDK